jgi:AraC-like DNA-binding protein
MKWPPGYREWAPPAALRGSVPCLWVSVAPPARPQVTLVLPDGCPDLIWESGRGVFVAGPDTGPVPTPLAPGTIMVGVRLRPGAGGPALGMPLSGLLNQRVDAADVGSGLTTALARRVPAGVAPAAALRLLTDAVGSAVADRPADPLVTWAARLLARPPARAGQAAARLGVGERQLLRRCQAAVGYGPATLRRVLRFRRFLALADAGGGTVSDLARIAAEAGYADQPHLTRDCTRLAGLPPVALIAARRPRPA